MQVNNVNFDGRFRIIFKDIQLRQLSKFEPLTVFVENNKGKVDCDFRDYKIEYTVPNEKDSIISNFLNKNNINFDYFEK